MESARSQVTSRSLLGRARIARRSDGIDSLRALLALWVLLTHLAEWGPLTATGAAPPIRAFERATVSAFQSHGEAHPAVLAFIVLSGYCIHRNGARHDGWSLRGYAIKRLFRIWPVYVLATLAGAALFSIAVHHASATTKAITATGGISAGCLAAKLSALPAIVPNLHLYTCSYQGNAPLATVMVEMWLYVVYAGLAWLLLTRMREWMLWTIVVVATLVGFLGVEQSPAHLGWWNNGSLLGFLPFWWIGAALVGELSRRVVIALGVLSVAVWTAGNVALEHAPRSLAIAEIRSLAYGLFAGVIIRGLDVYAQRLPRPVTLVGRSGYSLYAFHAPILIVLIAFGVPWWIVVFVAIAGSLAIFVVYEDPLTKYGRRRARPFRAVPEVAPSAAGAAPGQTRAST